jgi:hypothetical protein
MRLQIGTDCAATTTYGRLFHQLLQQRGLLLLGLYRPVLQDGLSFRATITNPRYVSNFAEQYSFTCCPQHVQELAVHVVLVCMWKATGGALCRCRMHMPLSDEAVLLNTLFSTDHAVSVLHT